MALPVLRSKDLAHKPRYQLWTDAICLRVMANQAPNNYLRSMCVRNAVLAASTTLEMACCEALGVSQLPDRTFKEGLKKALAALGKPAIDFGSGLWQRVLQIRESRNDYTHVGAAVINLFPAVRVAEEAIGVMREAIHDIYARMDKTSPVWVNFDSSAGWPQIGGITGTAFPSIYQAGTDLTAPETFRIVLVTVEGAEKPTEYLAGTTPQEDLSDKVEDLIGRLNVPFRGVRIYQGPNLIYDEPLDMRG